MGVFYYRTEQFLPVDIGQAWNFFSSAKNLALITPPELDFNILTEIASNEIHEGMIIEYIVKPLFGIPVRWKTIISEVVKPLFFVDTQIAGPYRTWIHKHVFIEKDNGILMKDEVKYELSHGLIGNLVHFLIVRKKIKEIFEYREQILYKIFVTNELPV